MTDDGTYEAKLLPVYYPVNYVGHSFNQFIQEADGRIIAVDHGDAYPRSIVLTNYTENILTDTVDDEDYPETEIMKSPGRIGENVTGASVGGLAISDAAYLVAGNSVIQDDQNLTRKTRNLFVAAVDRSTGSVDTKWITDYAEGSEGVSTPHLVKFSNNEFMLLWSESGEVCYTYIDGNGNRTSDIYRHSGELSDCPPLVHNGSLVWYVSKNSEISFYQISLSDPSDFRKTLRDYDHDYERTALSEDKDKATLKCTLCNVVLDGKTYMGESRESEGIYTLKKLNKPKVNKASKTEVKVSWNNINGETGYEIYRSTRKSGGFKPVKTVKSTTAKSTKLKATKNQKYYYKIRAYNAILVDGKHYRVCGPWSPVKSYKLR